ncbi:MAG: GNAT family N-acetyltransferase [Coriobacteriales bacterium]|nr:GNAT family N-acetyltransferase [Coriobacteriales bacterium]
MARKLRPLGPEHLQSSAAPCNGCMFWESGTPLERRCGSRCDPDEWAAWWRRVADEWGAPGRVALEDDEVLGFVKYAPAQYFPQVNTFACHPGDPDVVLLSCLHVRPDARHHGLGKVLMQAALRDLALRGVRRVEAYGAVHRNEPIEDQPMLTVEFLVREGFTVAQPDAEHPLFRIDLKSLVSIADNIEAMLESLRFPLRNRAPQRVPTPWIKANH